MMESEKEKMLSGKLYKAFGEELLQERRFAQEQTYIFNSLPPGKTDERNAVIRGLFGGIKGSFLIEPPFRCDYGYNIEIGENFYANYNLVILDCAKVTIGDDVLIGPNVSIYTAGHPVNHELRAKEYEFAFPINIGNHVWIGGNVIINPGVSVGNRSVVGAGSVVTKDIPANVIAVGNPCRVVREITDADQKFYFKNFQSPLED